MRALRSSLRSAGPLMLLLCGCTGVLDGASPSSGAPAAGGGGAAMSGGAGSVGVTPTDCQQPSAPALQARLLSPSQYEHAVEDLVGVADHPAKDFGGGVAARLDELAVEQRANAAAAIAAQASANLAAWAPCQPAAATCGAQIVEQLGRAAYRHPLTDAERTQLQALFDAGTSEKDFATGVEWLLAGLLQTPDFLYQLSKPASGESGKVVALEPYELASRLSFFVWDSAPDAGLFDAAATGRLATKAGVEAELERMLGHERFARGIAAFYGSWLGLEGFGEVARDEPALTSQILDALERSLLLSATSLYASATPTFAQLLTGESYYLDSELAAFYGVSAGGSGLAAVALPGEGRRGILTHPGLLTLLARPNASDPIARGLFLQRTLLCNEIPPPPQGVVIPPLEPVSGQLSTRARLERHTREPLCAACHDQIDPPGFALESYDEVGRFRAQDGGQPVDTSGSLALGKDVDGAFANGGELLDRIAQSRDARACFADHYLRFAVARALEPQDACSLAGISNEFAQAGDLKRLIVAVASSDTFRLRSGQELAP